MKTTQLFNAAKIFSLASIVFFTACSEGEDPMPENPMGQDTTTTTPGLPTGGGGNNPGGGLPGGGGDNPGGLPGGGTGGGTGGGGNGPLGGGGNQPTNDSDAIGVLSAGGTQYEYTLFGHQALGQADENGEYPITLGYFDQEADAAGGEAFGPGNIALIEYRPDQPGVIQPDTYTYDLQTANEGYFSYLFFGVQGSGYLLANGTIDVENTQTNGLLLISIDGYVVQIDEQGNLVSEEQIPVEVQLVAPAQPEINARTAGVDLNVDTTPFMKLTR